MRVHLPYVAVAANVLFMLIETTLNLPTLLTIIVTVVGVVTWLVRLEGRVGSTAKDQSDTEKRLDGLHALTVLSQNQLAEYKTHVAEHYVTKQGMNEQTDRLMKAVNDVGQRVESIGSRIDHFYANPPRNNDRV